MFAILRAIAGWVAAVLTAYFLSVGFAQAVIVVQTATTPVVRNTPGNEGPLGMPPGAAIGSLIDALANMTTLLPVYAVALFIGLSVAFLLKRILRPLAAFAYPSAGAVALIVPLILMSNIFGVIPLLGAQALAGLLLQLLAGIASGLVFARITRKGAGRV